MVVVWFIIITGSIVWFVAKCLMAVFGPKPQCKAPRCPRCHLPQFTSPQPYWGCRCIWRR
jgi:hypothetical protein